MSSVLRAEASKLFWANPKAYFLVSSNWLTDGAYPAYTHCNISFLPYVQNVLVDSREGTDQRIFPIHDETMVVRPERITVFWNSLTKRCPNVKRVFIDQNWLSSPRRMESQQVPRALRILIHSSPSDIQTSTFIVEETNDTPTVCSASILSTPTCQRSLYRPSAGGIWALVKSPQPWKTILPPAKKFNGPVGRYQQLDYNRTLTQLQRNGLWPLMVEALDRHYFYMGNNELFSCPSSTCNAYFQKAGEWTIHAAESHYNDWVTRDRFSILPRELRVEFEEREKALGRKEDEIRRIFNNMRDDWREGSVRKQREKERGWIEQLEKDMAWNTGTTPKESRLWQNLLQQMEYEDPRH